MDDLTYNALKQHILSSLDISSGDLSQLAQAFSKLYLEFQTDIVKEMTVEAVPNTCFQWVRSKNSDPHKVLLFFHGGGYTMGSTQNHMELIAQLISKTKVSVLSVDYRLLPDHPFPAPFEDAEAAYLWLLKNGFKAENIGFSGLSSGALLATQLILSCQEKKIELPKIALILSGPRNLLFDAPSIEYNADRDWITAKRLKNVATAYIPKNTQSPLLSPIAANYSHYPTTLFQAGDYEMLIDDSISFYQHLREQQLSVYLNIVPALPHCWQLFSNVYEPGRVAIQSAADFINNYF